MPYRPRFQVFVPTVAWGFFLFFFFFFPYLVTNKQTEKEAKTHIRRLRLVSHTQLAFKCLAWYCKHINFNKFLWTITRWPECSWFCVLHISHMCTFIIKIVTKKGNFKAKHIGKVWSERPAHCLTFDILSNQTSTYYCSLFNLRAQISVDLFERMLWERIQDHITFVIASRADSNIKSTNLS